MTISRATTCADRHALKLATKRTIRMCGGQESASEITRVGAKTLSDYSNTGNERYDETFIPLDVLADLAKDCAESGEVAPIIEKLCELAGGRFVRVHGDGVQDLLDDLDRATTALRSRVATREAAE